MLHTACLVCLISTVSGCRKNAIGRGSSSSGHIKKLEQSTFLRYLWVHSINQSSLMRCLWPNPILCHVVQGTWDKYNQYNQCIDIYEPLSQQVLLKKTLPMHTNFNKTPIKARGYFKVFVHWWSFLAKPAVTVVQRYICTDCIGSCLLYTSPSPRD